MSNRAGLSCVRIQPRRSAELLAGRRNGSRTRALLAFGMSSNGHTYFVNASMCTRSYNPSNDLIVVDVPMPAQACKVQPNVSYFTGLRT